MLSSAWVTSFRHWHRIWKTNTIAPPLQTYLFLDLERTVKCYAKQTIAIFSHSRLFEEPIFKLLLKARGASTTVHELINTVMLVIIFLCYYVTCRMIREIPVQPETVYQNIVSSLSVVIWFYWHRIYCSTSHKLIKSYLALDSLVYGQSNLRRFVNWNK